MGIINTHFIEPKLGCFLPLEGRWLLPKLLRGGIPVLVALCGSVLGRNTKGGTIVVGALNLGGPIEMIPNAVRIAELAIDKQAQTLLMPVSARRQLNCSPRRALDQD
jgi:predicted ATP-dependent Lon-type protease